MKNSNPFPAVAIHELCVNDKLIRTTSEGRGQLNRTWRLLFGCELELDRVHDGFHKWYWTVLQIALNDEKLVKIIGVCCVYSVHCAKCTHNNNHCANVSNATQKPEVGSGQWHALQHTQLFVHTPSLSLHLAIVTISIGKLLLRIFIVFIINHS